MLENLNAIYGVLRNHFDGTEVGLTWLLLLPEFIKHKLICTNFLKRIDKTMQSGQSHLGTDLNASQ